MKTSPMMAALYVGDLHPNVTEAMLFERFSPAGPIHSIRLCRDRNTGSSLGYAYVNFEHRADAERAVDLLNFELLMEQPMRVMQYERDPSVRKNGIGNIFIGNLDKSIDTMALFDTFSVFGKVLSCKAVGYETGSKGYGYVQFESVEAAELAIEKLNGKLLNDRQVFIERFKVREERKAEAAPRSGESQTKKHQFEEGLTLYIKDLDGSIDDESLRKQFSLFGTVINAKVMMENGCSRGFGFVRFSSAEEATNAIKEMNGRMWGRKPVYVGVAKRKEDRKARTSAQKTTPRLNIGQAVPPPSYVTIPEVQKMAAYNRPSQVVEPRLDLHWTTAKTSQQTAPVADSVPPEEHYPAVDSVPAVNIVPAVDNISAVDPVPAVDNVTAIDPVPAVDNVPAIDPVPAVDNVPTFDLVPAVDSIPTFVPATAEEMLPAETVPGEENAPVRETVPLVDSFPVEGSSDDRPTSPPVKKELTIYMLESVPVDQQIQMAYDYMAPLVEKIHPTKASSITRMLLEGENNFGIINMIRDPELLRARVDEMDALIKARETGHKLETLKTLYTNTNSNKRRRKNRRKH